MIIFPQQLNRTQYDHEHDDEHDHEKVISQSIIVLRIIQIKLDFTLFSLYGSFLCHQQQSYELHVQSQKIIPQDHRRGHVACMWLLMVDHSCQRVLENSFTTNDCGDDSHIATPCNHPPIDHTPRGRGPIMCFKEHACLPLQGSLIRCPAQVSESTSALDTADKTESI